MLHTVYKKGLNLPSEQQLDVIDQNDITPNIHDKGVTELQNLANLTLSSFAESHWVTE